MSYANRAEQRRDEAPARKLQRKALRKLGLSRRQVRRHVNKSYHLKEA